MEKKFRIYALLTVFVLLTALLTVINGVNFTMAAEDADRLTGMLAERQGSFERRSAETAQTVPGNRGFRLGPMGPDSPEMNASLRYFTVAFSEKGDKSEILAFNISAVTEEEAQEWAAELLGQKTGWTRGTYRFRVYKDHGTVFVTVIDQGRELLPSFRILIISAVGEALALVICWFVLLAIGRRVCAPIVEADRKQRNFIRSANREFRIPLTIIDGNTELIERRHGPDDETRSTHRQVSKLSELVDKLDTVGIFDDGSMSRAQVPLSEYLSAALDREAESFNKKGIAVEANIEPGITLTADPDAMDRLTGEIVKNAVKYALSKAEFTLKREKGHVLLEAQNDASLPDGPADQVFDRFTLLENAQEGSAGLGLSYVREAVKAHGGRIAASVTGGRFTLLISL